MTNNNNNNIYYDPSRALSHKRLLTFIIGSRGIGKTYAFKKLAIKRALETHKPSFVWVRRYGDDIKALKNNFFRDIETEFPDYEFSANVEILWARVKEPKGDWFQIGSFIPLSYYERYKGNSFHTVEYLVFDEFITQGRYLTEEVFKFYDLLETVFRDRDKMRAILLANAISQLNPYFEVFKIKIQPDNKFLSSDRWVVENIDAEEWALYKAGKPTGRLLENTDYAQYAIANRFVLDDASDVIPKPKSSLAQGVNFTLNGLKIGIWTMNGGIYFGEPSDSRHNFTIYVQDARDGAVLLDKNSRHVKYIATGYRKNKVLGFSSLAVKREILAVAMLGIKNYQI
jgi:hypothetical protein